MSAYPDQQQGWTEPAPPPPSPMRVRVVMVVAVVLFAALAGFAVSRFIGGGGSGGASDAPASSGDTATAQDSRPRVEVQANAKTCAAATTDAPYAVKAGNANTSCPFALAVRSGYVSAAPNGGKAVVQAVSPVTGKKYAMECADTAPVKCTGGNGAVVYLVP